MLYLEKNKTKENQVMSLFTVMGLAIGKSIIMWGCFLATNFLKSFFHL